MGTVPDPRAATVSPRIDPAAARRTAPQTISTTRWTSRGFAPRSGRLRTGAFLGFDRVSNRYASAVTFGRNLSADTAAWCTVLADAVPFFVKP